ncbi:hypothetical protein L1887_30842 [Cichorium endivia]|nr:hypothetical protein L1887_30842 [Cichorium endivia]
MDPAILAIGGSRVDMRSSFPSQHASYENDNMLRILMQRSFTQQNQIHKDVGDSYPPRTDAYGLPSRILEQIQSSGCQVPVICTTEHLGFENLHSVYLVGDSVVVGILEGMCNVGFYIRKRYDKHLIGFVKEMEPSETGLPQTPLLYTGAGA